MSNAIYLGRCLRVWCGNIRRGGGKKVEEIKRKEVRKQQQQIYKHKWQMVNAKHICLTFMPASWQRFPGTTAWTTTATAKHTISLSCEMSPSARMSQNQSIAAASLSLSIYGSNSIEKLIGIRARTRMLIISISFAMLCHSSERTPQFLREREWKTSTSQLYTIHL